MDNNLALATREVLWGIPALFKALMYGSMFLAFGFMYAGFKNKLSYALADGEKISDAFPDKFQWKAFFQNIFFMGKVMRNKYAAIFHALVFYGFLVLWIATDIVAVHYDTPFKIFTGWTYIIVSFTADVAGIAILIGLALAYYRRYVVKEAKLKAKDKYAAMFMYVMLALLVIQGYLIEGIRIMAAGMPEGEASWAPVGWALASLFDSFHIRDAVWASGYKWLWLVHMFNTMAFIASLTYSSFAHMFILPLQALITPKGRGAILEPMDFEDETKETFGLADINELTVKTKFDLLSCIECGRCEEVCPAKAAEKPLNPKTIVTKTRDLLTDTIEKGESSANIWAKNLFSDNEIDSCTTCGACMEECPSNIEHVPLIMEAKRYKTLTEGRIPPAAATAVENTLVNGNPWGLSQEDRFKWADGLEVPVIEPSKKVDYLYYVGCAGSYDNNNQKVVQDTVKLLKTAGVDFAVLGKTEKCNGDPIRRFGDEYNFFEIAIGNIATLKEYQFDKIVTHCPHCFHTIGKEYAKFEDGEFDVVHHTELLDELIKAGKLKPKKEINKELTYHDPCYIGRHDNNYKAPRDIIKSIPGMSLKEMDKSKDKARCCGMGGGNMWYEVDEGKHLSENRLEDIAGIKVETLATSCSYCMINFHSTKANVKETEKLEINDVASFLAESIIEN